MLPPIAPRVAVGAADDVQLGHPKTALLSPGEKGRIRQAIVARTAGGELRGYLNLCRHLPVPLDTLSGDLMSRDRRYLECATHGALFRPEDGHCVAGPCQGAALFALELIVEDGIVYAIDAPVERS